ncbi:DNA-directed DNA polymerase [Alkanindiges hydrocarboniclasticus]|uniref:DNA-directed DNA polymerase n=1 Tax=Alkanindiges hydrocarboniclasticus TaxID=1907941 RepID=A0A1S8CQB6_9GAMM|nr:Y-family DNA polymerase [Alkanindiges hydrocarboniclasticus]ONG37405.1 DNA-directed DNA polymerase [Alkanindiges hydrocarboniclasticus]
MASYPKERVFAIVDINNCYVSCERLFNPSLLCRPVIVLSNNDGCVVARSEEAKQLGIKMGQPVFQLRDMIRQHHIAVLSSNYALYGEMSKRFMSVLSHYVGTGEQEIYSIDECFLELTHHQNRINLTDYAHEIRNTILQWLGLPVCIGIGTSKTLAKIANHLAKKNPAFNGVYNMLAIDPIHTEAFLTKLDTKEVWGVGRRHAAKLKTLNIHTVMDLMNVEPKYIRSHFSVVMERTVLELNGTCCLELEEVVPDRQQIVCSRSFGSYVTELPILQEALNFFALRAIEKLRGQQLLTNSIGVFIHTNRFNPQAAYHPYIIVNLTEATDDRLLIIKAASRGLSKIYKEGFKYKKAGIVLLNMVPRSKFLPSLFTDRELLEKRQNLSDVLDAINQKFGRDTVDIANCSKNKADWQMSQANKSPNYFMIDSLMQIRH